MTGGADTDRIQAMANNTVIGLSSLATVESITGGAFSGVSILGSPANNTLNFGAVTLTNIDRSAAVRVSTRSLGRPADDVIVGGTR